MADAEFVTNDYEAAFGRLVAVVARTSDGERASAQKRLLELFDIAGPHEPAVAKARTALANALF